MREAAASTEPMPTLRDDFVRIVARAEAAERDLAAVARDIDRLLRGAKPDSPRGDESNMKDIGPQSIVECLAAFARSVGNIEFLTEKLKAVREDLAPATGGRAAPSPYRDHPPFAEEPRRPSGERYG